MKERIRKYLKKHGMTPSRLADLAGVKRWSLCRYLKYDDADVTVRTYNKISKFIGLNP